MIGTLILALFPDMPKTVVRYVVAAVVSRLK